jgi:hypothetical protein
VSLSSVGLTGWRDIRLQCDWRQIWTWMITECILTTGWITNCIRSEVLKVVSVNTTVFWVVQTEAGRLFKMSEPAHKTKWHHVPNYCNHDVIELSYRQSFMIYLFLIHLHVATKHYPNVIMVSFQNQHWILQQEGHNECRIQWHTFGTNKQASLWNVTGRKPHQDVKLFHFRDCPRPWYVGKPSCLDATFCPLTFHWIL